MKQILIILIFLVSGITFSQNKSVSKKNPEKQELTDYKLKLKEDLEYKTKTLAKELELNESQRNEVYDVLLFHAEKNYETKAQLKKQFSTDKNLNKEDAKAKFKKLEKDSYNSINSAFKKIFSEQQWLQYEALLSQAKTAEKNKKFKN